VGLGPDDHAPFLAQQPMTWEDRGTVLAGGQGGAIGQAQASRWGGGLAAVGDLDLDLSRGDPEGVGSQDEVRKRQRVTPPEG
jgi:hypothetical protein